jgi:prepilin-type N-terminal cleavage/methylation domain-containing protein
MTPPRAESREPRARTGLTLIELVVAVTIAGIVLAAGYAALGQIADSRQRARAATDVVSRSAAIRRTIRAWVAGARLTIEEDAVVFRGLDGVHDGGDDPRTRSRFDLPDDEVTFLTTATTPLGANGTVVRIFVDRDEKTPERGLVARLTELGSVRAATVELEPHVSSLDVRYLSSVLGAPQWLPSWISSSVMPGGVELRIGALSADSLPPLLSLPLTVAFGGGA